MLSLKLLASNTTVQCVIVDSQGSFNYRQSIDIKKNFEHEFTDRLLQEVKFKISFSNALNTIDSFIEDEDLNIEALSTEGLNDTPKGAHSAVRLTTLKGNFILSCSIVGVNDNRQIRALIKSSMKRSKTNLIGNSRILD